MLLNIAERVGSPNSNTHRVKLVTMDLGFNEASYRAYVRTVDLTPPDFTSINM